MTEGIGLRAHRRRRRGSLKHLSLAPLAQPTSPDGHGAAMVGIEPVVTPRGALELGSSQTTPTHLCDTLQQNAMPQPVLPFAVAAAQASPTTSPSRASPSLEPSFPGRMADVDSLSAWSDLSPPSTRSIPRASRTLKLPSFDLLGIAAPHPDHIDRTRAWDVASPFSSVGAAPAEAPPPIQSSSRSLSWPGKVVCDRDPRPGHDPTTLPFGKAIKQYISTVTPPDESGIMDWGDTSQDPSPPPPAPGPAQPAGRPSTIPIPASVTAAEQTAPFVQPVGLVNPEVSIGETHGWLEDVLALIAIEDTDGHKYSNTLQMLSHALPCPVPAGHAFSLIVRALQEARFRRITFINVFHAVPGRFNLADLPTSPPSTPGPAVGGDDYFAVTTYDSAVLVSDYQAESTLIPAGPQPVVAPSTMDLGVVERYIPPTNRNEVHGLFRHGGPSILVDRLAELAFDGHLIFVYPTKTGGRTFMDSYLGPLLDPILRFMNVVNNLPSSVCRDLGKMISVDVLPTYEDLLANIEALCRRLNRPRGGVAAGELDRFNAGRRRAHYQVLHARKEAVVLERKVWAKEWWVKQEKPRIRETISQVYPTDQVPSNLHLVQEILDGVSEKARYQDGEEPTTTGVEVGVFVVKKTLEAPTIPPRRSDETGPTLNAVAGPTLSSSV